MVIVSQWFSPVLSSSSSGSSCSLAAGLESLGLTDIRTLVRLMCLAAAGRAGLSTSPATGSGPSERPRGAAKASKPISCLAYLSTAVGCLASNSPNAAKLLVQLCTQVSRLIQSRSYLRPVSKVNPLLGLVLHSKDGMMLSQQRGFKQNRSDLSVT